jgi:hypothetical protein
MREVPRTNFAQQTITNVVLGGIVVRVLDFLPKVRSANPVKGKGFLRSIKY